MLAEVQPRTVPYEFLGPPGAFNPTLLMLLASIVLIVGTTLGYFLDFLPHWVVFTLNVLALHLAGTVIHNASHNVAHRSPVMNAVMGHTSAFDPRVCVSSLYAGAHAASRQCERP